MQREKPIMHWCGRLTGCGRRWEARIDGIPS
jgi:hypothetical protein